MLALYKFRTLGSSDELKRIKDIIEKGEFWCSKFYEMNDPMEGIYHSNSIKLSEKIFDEKNQRVICSFSSKNGFMNPIMWGYYANGFKGISIEVEIEKGEDKIKKIEYVSDIHTISSKKLFSNVDRILTTKLDKWKHEKEYRFITQSAEKLHKIGRIKKIYIGNPYGNIINRQNVIDNNKKIKEYLNLKAELEEFLNSKKIEYCEVMIDGNKVISLDNI